MADQMLRYPSSAQVTVSAIGSNGATAPTTSIQIGAEDPSGDLEALRTNAAGELLVSIDDAPLPPGAATEAKQDIQITAADLANTLLGEISSNTLAIAKDTGQLVTVDYATEATLSAISGQLPTALGQTTAANSLAVVLASNQPALPLPTNAATLSEQQAQTTLLTTGNANTLAISGQLPATLGQKTSANSLAVVVSSDQSPIPVSQQGATSASLGRDYVNSSVYDYAASPVTTGAWAEVIANIGVEANEIYIFDSSGQILELGIGPAASETRVTVIVPGGNERVPLQVPANSRLSVKAISATANVGNLVINLYS